MGSSPSTNKKNSIVRRSFPDYNMQMNNALKSVPILKNCIDTSSYITPKNKDSLIELKSVNSSYKKNLMSKMNNNEDEFKVSMNDFDKLKVIGKGAFGKVILARSKKDGNLYAIKCIKKYFIMKTKTVKNIVAERKILEKISHPFIISLKGSFQDSLKLYMVFEYFNGGELFFHLKNEQNFSEKLAKFYAAEIYIALRYLHSQNIVYRDLKPENIILDSCGHIKLIDFGLSKDNVNTYNPTKTVCGTQEYMSPEMLMGKPYSHDFDWWCFGNLIYEMLYGRPPFSDKSFTSLCRKIDSCELKFPEKEVSDQAKDLIKKLLVRKVENRLKAEEIPNHDWFSDISFEELLNKKFDVPFIPRLIDIEDFSNIDPVFLKESIDSPVKTHLDHEFLSKLPYF